MNLFNLKALTLALSLTLFGLSAQANTLVLSADTNISDSAEQYQFSNSVLTGTSFSDVINLEITPFRDLVASITGTSSSLINFTTFDLYSGVFGGTSMLVQTGDVFSPIPQLSIGTITDSGSGTIKGLSGSYYILVEGMQTGSSSYNGNISLVGENVSAVPAPAALPLMLSGLALFGFMQRRKSI